MLFNSIEFAIFLPVIFILHWGFFNKNIKLQNLLLLNASYFFYACWDWRFLSLIIFSSIVDYIIGLKLSITKKLSAKYNMEFWDYSNNNNFIQDEFFNPDHLNKKGAARFGKMLDSKLKLYNNESISLK